MRRDEPGRHAVVSGAAGPPGSSAPHDPGPTTRADELAGVLAVCADDRDRALARVAELEAALAAARQEHAARVSELQEQVRAAESVLADSGLVATLDLLRGEVAKLRAAAATALDSVALERQNAEQTAGASDTLRRENDRLRQTLFRAPPHASN